MKQLNSILVLIALMLSLGVLVSSVAPYLGSRASASLCETEEDCLEECLEELLEEQFDHAEDLILMAWRIVEAGPRASAPQQMPSGVYKLSPAHCSFGWMLPLRM